MQQAYGVIYVVKLLHSKNCVCDMKTHMNFVFKLTVIVFLLIITVMWWKNLNVGRFQPTYSNHTLIITDTRTGRSIVYAELSEGQVPPEVIQKTTDIFGTDYRYFPISLIDHSFWLKYDENHKQDSKANVSKNE